MQGHNADPQTIHEAAQSIADRVSDYLGTSLNEPIDAAEESPSNAHRRERTVRSLDDRTPHSLNEDFTLKRPIGFSFRDTHYRDVRTWKRMYEQVCRLLADHDDSRFAQLPEMNQFKTKRGNRYFATDACFFRTPRQITEGVHAETHFSANGLRDRMRELLDVFDLPEDSIDFYLREAGEAFRRYRGTSVQGLMGAFGPNTAILRG